MTQRVVSIVGPTASGKTGLGIAIARRLAEAGERAEIVNADAYQMYRGMDIGTAKPTAEEQAAVPHHLIDIIDPEDTMSVARFQQLARETIADLQSRGIRPILVGGSGLYARAAIDDITFPGTDPDVRTRLEEREKTEGAGALFDELRAKDPEAAARMDPRNPRRTIRALEVIELTGKPYSASLPRYRYVIPSVQIGLDLDRPDLDHRIDLRTKQMYDDGFIEEVERLRPHLGATAVRALGYQQIIDLLDGIWDVNDAFADIAQKTKRLARKQMGWFGRDPRIHWLQALNHDLRTKQMYDDGFIEEVERLRPHLGATAVRALGYQQIIDLLDGIWDVNDAFADIAQKTKRLARKQMGWFGRDPRIHWLQALNPKLVDNAMAIIAHADAGDYDPIDARADEYTQHHLGDITA